MVQASMMHGPHATRIHTDLSFFRAWQYKHKHQGLIRAEESVCVSMCRDDELTDTETPGTDKKTS